ncbi:hypothetical protein LP421_15090 [Rhizobium sp. RCAM05350]|nr:hypothetical protein LP421_15090 [Rhizobium sp. RCAM05350]
MHEMGCTADDLIQMVVRGELKTPHGILKFSKVPTSSEFSFTEHHPEGISQYSRYAVLTITSGDKRRLDLPALDWELKGLSEPYDSLLELQQECRLGSIFNNTTVFEAISTNMVAVDLSSTMDDQQCNIGIMVAAGLPRERVQIGYRELNAGNVVERGQLQHGNIAWQTTGTGELQRGVAKISVLPASVVHCYALYDGVAHHQGWLQDPNNVQNPRMAVYKAFDDSLQILRSYLHLEEKPPNNSRDLEFGVAWLLWMMGFSCAQIGGTGKTSDAVDLVAVTPNGHYAVVECTTGLLKTENKLPLLLSRTALVQQRLRRSNNTYAKVMPVLVTTKTRTEVVADLEQAEKLGVLVITSEDILSAIDRVIYHPDADRYFSDAEKLVAEGGCPSQCSLMTEKPRSEGDLSGGVVSEEKFQNVTDGVCRVLVRRWKKLRRHGALNCFLKPKPELQFFQLLVLKFRKGAASYSGVCATLRRAVPYLAKAPA